MGRGRFSRRFKEIRGTFWKLRKRSKDGLGCKKIQNLENRYILPAIRNGNCCELFLLLIEKIQKSGKNERIQKPNGWECQGWRGKGPMAGKMVTKYRNWLKLTKRQLFWTRLDIVQWPKFAKSWLNFSRSDLYNGQRLPNISPKLSVLVSSEHGIIVSGVGWAFSKVSKVLVEKCLRAITLSQQ